MSEDFNKDLEKERLEINDIDQEIVKLLDERAKHVKLIGDMKKQQDVSVYQPDREKEVKEKVLNYSKQEFPTEALLQIYTEIISAARSLEQPIHVGYLGPEGTNTEMAVNKHFGTSVITSPLSTISDVFRQVENGKVDYGVVPIENSLEGTINVTLDEFVDSPLQVVGENYLTIHHNILANVNQLSEIKRIYSHPQGFSQCRIWLESNLPNVEKIESSSTAKAASMVPWDKFSAAIASPIAAEKYGLNIVESNIEDNPENYTRFWIIANKKHQVNKAEKTTILASVKDKPGALLRLLSPFQVYELNLTKIESRPSKRKAWDYIFFMDIQGGVQSSAVNKAVEKIKEETVFLKVLGSYPMGQL